MPSLFPYSAYTNALNDEESRNSFGDKAMSVGKVIATEVPSLVASTVAEGYKLPPYKMENEGINAEVAGKGTGSWYDWLNYSVDRANDVTAYTKFGQNIASKAKPSSLMGMGGSLVDSRFLKNRGVGANLATGLAVGVGSDLAADLYNDKVAGEEQQSNWMQDLADAEFYGDDELKARIFAAMNKGKNKGKDAKILAHGLGTGSILGPKGAALGLGAASAVVGLRKLSPEVHHDFDPEFARTLRERQRQQRQANAGIIGSSSRGDEYTDAAEMVTARALDAFQGKIPLSDFDKEDRALAERIIANARAEELPESSIRQAMNLDNILTAIKEQPPSQKRANSREGLNKKYSN